MTFDCFGTLIDWTSGFRAILKPLAGHRADALMAEYHRAERALEAEKPHRRYRDVLTRGMQQAAETIGLDLAASDADSLVRSWGELPLYQDVPAAFAVLRDAGWKIAMLTNCDDDLFAATAARNPALAPDLVITAEQVGGYKPEFGHFARFEQRTGVKRQNWVHAACSWRHDIDPARHYGVTRIWVDRDRTGEDPAAATHVVPDVAALAGLGL